jgi:type 1 glutamine amidotransferase
VDLLIVNAGDPWRVGDEANPAHPGPVDEGLVRDGILGLEEAFARGIRVLGIHSAASSLRDYPQMREALAGEWAPGHSWHPPLSELVITPVAAVGLEPFAVEDERYTDLVFTDDVEVMANCIQEESTYPLAWKHTFGSSQVVVDTLGHDERSYQSPGHVDLLTYILGFLGN